MQTLVLVFTVYWFILSSFKLKYSLHMMQLEGYKNEKYIDWINSHKDKIFTSKDKLYTIISIINTLFYLFLIINKENKYLYTISVVVVFVASFILTFNSYTRYESKKPLVMTNRATRLLVISILLVAVDFIILIFLVSLTTDNIVEKFPLWSGLISLIYLFSSYYIVLANYIARPIEKRINKKYYDKAAQKIKGMEGDLISVGITGSYGKTSTKFAAATILKEKYNVLNTPDSYNTPMGISMVINDKLTNEHDVFVAELGATKVGDIDEVAKLTNPKIGILTSIGPCHLESFKSIENIMRTKYELIENLPDDGVAIFNYDNEYVKKLADKTFKEKLLYGINNIEETDVFATDIKVDNTGSKFTLCINKLGTINCETKLLGEHNILNILAAASVGKVLGLSLEEIKAGISKIEGVEHRLQLIDAKTGVLVIDDAFNSNPDGAKAALEVLDSFKDFRKIIVTPGMVELGNLEEIENEKLGENIAIVCDIVILVGKNRTVPIYKGLKNKGFNEDNLYVVNSLNEASELLKTITRVNDVVLFENDLPDTYNEQ